MSPSTLDCTTPLREYTPAVPPALLASEAYQFWEGGAELVKEMWGALAPLVTTGPLAPLGTAALAMHPVLCV